MDLDVKISLILFYTTSLTVLGATQIASYLAVLGIVWSPVGAAVGWYVHRRRGWGDGRAVVTGFILSLLFLVPWVLQMVHLSGRTLPRWLLRTLWMGFLFGLWAIGGIGMNILAIYIGDEVWYMPGLWITLAANVIAWGWVALTWGLFGREIVDDLSYDTSGPLLKARPLMPFWPLFTVMSAIISLSGAG